MVGIVMAVPSVIMLKYSSINSHEARDPVQKYEVSVSGRGDQSPLTFGQKIHMWKIGAEARLLDKNNYKFLS